MVEKARRVEVAEPRPDADPAWEVFARDETDDPLRYVGTVRADDADGAHERATRLFCWYADEVWVCPTAEIGKYAVGGTGEAESSSDGSESESSDDGDEAKSPKESDLAVPEFGDEDRTHEL